MAGWFVVFALLLVLAARLFWWDSRASLVALNALTPVLFVPAWPVALGAAIGRRFRLAGVAALVVVGHITLMLPEVAASKSTLPAARPAPSFTLFYANVLVGNADVAGYAEELRRQAPDVVMLQESTPTFLAALEETGALRELPHRVAVSRSDPFAAMLASRWPLREEDVLYADGRPIVLRATTDVAGREVRLYAVHVVAPFGGNREAWADELEMVRAAIEAERRPVLAAGDFNATWGHRAFRRLLDLGLTDAAPARARLLDMTWPRGVPLLPAVTRIDHVLTTDWLTVTRIRTGRGRGSDHRPLLADVALA